MPKSRIAEKYEEVDKSKVHELAEDMKGAGARFVNLHATTLGEGEFQLTYTFSADEELTENYTVHVNAGDTVQSISDLFFAAFFFENETQDLFGIKIDGIALDYQGDFYQVALDEPPMARKSKDDDMYSVNRKNDATVPVKGSGSEEKGGDE